MKSAQRLQTEIEGGKLSLLEMLISDRKRMYGCMTIPAKTCQRFRASIINNEHNND